jgi:Flp pilus assembly protein TadD
MGRMLRATSALSAVAVAALIAGCANPMTRAHSASSSADGKANLIGAATRAQLALASGDFAGAVNWAEQAVGNSPRDHDLRGLLGNAYLGSGRFASAEAAYNDALTLAPNQPGVLMKLVLAQIAQGKGEQAVQMLDQLRGAADPADVGLAMALAGQPGNAVAVLDEAARRPGADGRTRQNLALAHALAGDWESARVVAGQDIPADQLDARIAEWMSMAKPSSPTVKVAALLGVTPAASDPGQPQRLALNDTGVRMASAAPVPAFAASRPAPAVTVPLPPVPEPQIAMADTTVMDNPGFAVPVEAAPTEIAAAAQPVQSALPPVEKPEQIADVSQALDSLRREPVKVSGTLPKVSQLRRSAAARFAKSGVVVQLGAYGSPKRVQDAWSKIERRHASLGRYTPVSARFQATSGTVYRLSLKGFATDREARLLCEQLKSSGSACFVRNAAGDTPVRFAGR